MFRWLCKAEKQPPAFTLFWANCKRNSARINCRWRKIYLLWRQLAAKMAFRPGISGKIFAALGENGISIRMISQGPEELNIIVGVDNADFEKTVRVLYESFVR